MAARPRGAVLSSIASVASVAAALSCCLPLGTLLMAAGSAGASGFSQKLRPYLLGFSVLMLAVAFVQTYRRSHCEFRQRKTRTIVLWTAAFIVGAMLIAPQFVAGVIADRFSPAHGAAAQARLDTFDGARFRTAFDAASDRPRLIVLLSPT